VKFGVRLRNWDTLPALNFVKIVQGDLYLGGIFTKKSTFSEFFSYLRPYFYTDNVNILLKKTENLGIYQRHKISSESLKWPAGIALPRGCDAYWFLVLFVFLSRFWNDEVCDNENAMKRCNFQNNDHVIAQKKVCSCAPIFNFFCGPPKFSNRGKFIPKIAIFRDFGGVGPHFQSQNNEIWFEGADLELPPLSQIL